MALWSGVGVHDTLFVSVLVEFDLDTSWNPEGADLVVQTEGTQGVDGLTGFVVVWNAFTHTLETVVLEEAGGFVLADESQGRDLVIHISWDGTLVSWIEESSLSVELVVVHGDSDVLSDLDG